MKKFLDPFTDQGFKLIFGKEMNKELLIEFLNDLLVGERQIEDLTFTDKEIQPESLGGRVIIFDILCCEPDGTQFIVEMQNQYQDYFFDRSLYYLCRMLSQQGRKGSDWHYETRPVYGIYFLNFRLPELDKLRTDVVLADQDTGRQMTRKLRQIYLSLPYFTLEVNECKTNFDRWIYMLKNMDRIEISPFDTQQRAIFAKLLDVANVDNLSPRERLQYEANLKAYRDYNSVMVSAQRISREEGHAEGREEGLLEGMEKGHAKGHAKGRKEGMQKGMEKGHAKGHAKGREEGREEGLAEGKRQLAARMKKEGYAIESIHQLTELSLDEIERL